VSELRADDVPALLARLAAAQAAIAPRTIDERLAALDRVSAAWLGDRGRVADAAAALARTTGHAPAMLEVALERTFAAWRGTGLRRAFAPVRAALASREAAVLAAPRSAAAGPAAIAVPPRLVAVVLAQNTPALAVAPAYAALAFGAAVVLKSARREATFAPLLAAAIAEADPELGAACAAVVWRGGDGAIERPLFAAADRVVVYGSSAAVAAVRERAGDRAVAHGPRASVAVVAGCGPGDATRDVARRLARDVAFLDQRGCLSPQAVLVDESVDASALARELGDALAALEDEWPRRRLTITEASAFRRAVDEAEAAVLAGRARALAGGGALPWAVVAESSPAIATTPLDRFVRIHPYSGPEGLRAALAPLRDALECVGLAAPPSAWTELAAACADAGAARVCAVGEMQDPPADWHAGGRPPFADLLRWSAVERPDSTPPASLRRGFEAHVAQTSPAPRGLAVASAHGSFVHDADGRAWLDLLSGIGVASIGHAHPAVARAVAEQAARYTHVMVYGEDVLEPQVELARRLASLLPPSLSVAYFVNSGAEAIEGAVKLARKATGRARILSFEGAFHGDTTGALALGGNPLYQDPFRPLLPEVEQIPWSSRAALARIDESVAAVVAEPVQAEAGVRVPDRDFLPLVAERCREAGALLVLDEVVTGLGRTGRWFAFEHWPGATPDVLVLAKALGGGLPLGAFVASPERMRVLAEDPPLGHVTTFGGNPVACAAALAALSFAAEERLPERALQVGDELRRALAELRGRGGLADVRGLGLLIGLEFESAAATERFVARCFERGVLVGWTLHQERVVRLAPPLTIARDEVELALCAIRGALDAG